MPTRLDHYVPQLLLRRFLEPEATTFLQVTLPTGRVNMRAPAAVCRDDGHDAVFGPDRELNEPLSEIHARYAKQVEDAVAPAVDRLHSGKPEPTDIGACLFLAGRMLAAAPYRRIAKAIANQRFGLSPWTQPLEEWQVTTEFCRILASKPWSVVTASGRDGEEFVTSDAPLALVPGVANGRLRTMTFNAALHGAAWAVSEIPLVFPIGRCLALVRDGRGDLFRPASRSEVATINSAIANFALHRTEWLVAHKLLPILKGPVDGESAIFPVVLAPTGQAILAHGGDYITVSGWADRMRIGWQACDGRVPME